jgi:K+-sensing histidine kinase KdpD
MTQFPELSELDQNGIVAINHLLTDLSRVASLGLITGVGLPLVANKRVVGIIIVFRAYDALFSSNDRALLSSFADQAAIAVHNAQLYSQIIQQKQRLDALLDSNADGLLILATNLTVERCNPSFVRLLGIPSGRIQGQPHESLIVWDKPPQGMTLEQAVAGGWPLTPHAQLYVEGDIVRSEKQPPLPVGITYAPLLSPDNVLINVIATVRDITRFRQAEELKSTFVSIVSHELKTPVALIKGYVSTLRREDADWDREIISESLSVIEEEADRLSLMIENLLDASRLQAGGFQLKRSEVFMPGLAKQVATRFQTQTDKHTIRVDFPVDFPVILADETRLEQVLSNLVANAIKYAPQGEILISGQIRPDIIIVTVGDEGPGIPTEDVPHVFDRFYRSASTARHTKGAGLGLYLSKSIIEAHGGRMWVDSSIDQGARLCFMLPRT